MASQCSPGYPNPSFSSPPALSPPALSTPNHTYVPWVVVNGETVPDDGSGYPSGDLTDIVCKAYEGDNLPDACA